VNDARAPRGSRADHAALPSPFTTGYIRALIDELMPRSDQRPQDGAICSARRRNRQTQTSGGSLQPPVACPQSGARSQPDRRKQMSGDVADAQSEERMLIDKVKNFSIRSDTGPGQVMQRAQNGIAPVQTAQGKLADHEGVWEPFPRRAARRALRRPGEDDRPRPKYRPGSLRFWPAARDRPQVRLRAAQTRQSPRTFALDQRFERLTDQCRLLPQAGIILSFGKQFLI
jgi:hypothetical protein